MDKLEAIFELQRSFQDKLKRERGLGDIPMTEWIQKHTLAIIAELAEVLDEVNYRWWKKPREVNAAHLQEELSDVLHFFVSMCIEAGMSADDLYAVYANKNKENFDRQNGLSDRKGYETDGGEQQG